jgi:hypothetical protein
MSIWGQGIVTVCLSAEQQQEWSYKLIFRAHIVCKKKNHGEHHSFYLESPEQEAKF